VDELGREWLKTQRDAMCFHPEERRVSGFSSLPAYGGQATPGQLESSRGVDVGDSLTRNLVDRERRRMGLRQIGSPRFTALSLRLRAQPMEGLRTRPHCGDRGRNRDHQLPQATCRLKSVSCGALV
jgi:hypothetical protein